MCALRRACGVSVSTRDIINLTSVSCDRFRDYWYVPKHYIAFDGRKQHVQGPPSKQLLVETETACIMMAYYYQLTTDIQQTINLGRTGVHAPNYGNDMWGGVTIRLLKEWK